ncbi:type III secretion system protein SctP [Paraburkholderia sp. BL21I4N1]|uniref:type III secretion system protein SctP n=1 Tax=Paraburkholderia sp. BL21I4N1 TaxID=1938801 RepID=UPI000CFDC6E1|nr:type III secretion system protein SctP [Paraburkholderia sp. BL21I4N1]PQV53157.1 type III secretion control protein HpaP [Paraburkholderia sp. BL21I4N1]
MTHIVSRHVRVIPGEADTGTADDAAARSASRGRGFDYASLLGRRRAVLRLNHQGDAHAGAGSQDDPSAHDAEAVEHASIPAAPQPFFSHDEGSSPQTAEDAAGSRANGAASAGHTPLPERLAIGSRVEDAAQPVVSAVYRQQQRFVQLLGSLAREIGAFCGDPSIAEAGNWEVQLPLDQKLLPQTTLYLTLSRFSLQLRFDTTDTVARQLLLEHSALLERELDTLLRAWGEARDIELTVW